MDKADDYILSQEEHHKVHVINDVQKKIFSYTTEQDTAYSSRVAE